jgi:hypothetical protein
MKVSVYFQISDVLHKVTFKKITVNSGARRHVESVWHSCLAHEGKNDVQKYPDRCCFDGCLFGYFRANRCCTRRSHCHAICDTDRRPRRQASCNASGHTSCARRDALCAQACSCCRTRCGPCRCTFSASHCCTRTRQSASLQLLPHPLRLALWRVRVQQWLALKVQRPCQPSRCPAAKFATMKPALATSPRKTSNHSPAWTSASSPVAAHPRLPKPKNKD